MRERDQCHVVPGWHDYQGHRLYTIMSHDERAHMTFLPDRGGVASSLVLPTAEGSQECLYLHDWFWQAEPWPDLPGGWPFCFPVCARLEADGQSGAYVYAGQTYTLPIHGFNWSMPWAVFDAGADWITMQLLDTPESQEMYPFAFDLRLTYRLSVDGMRCEFWCQNTGDTPMPYYAGFHPYLLTPAVGVGKDQVQLHYAPIKRFQYNEQLTGICGEQPLFDVPCAIVDPAVNEQLTQVGANKRALLQAPGWAGLSIEIKEESRSDLFSFVQLYTMADRPFFCVEHWMNAPNAMNHLESVLCLAPGQTDTAVCEVRVPTESL